MRIVWWFVGAAFVGQAVLIGLLGPERALGAVGLVNGPISLVGAGVAFVYWRRYQNSRLREQPLPLFPLSLLLILNGARYLLPLVSAAMGYVVLRALWVVSAWFLVAYGRIAMREWRRARARAA